MKLTSKKLLLFISNNKKQGLIAASIIALASISQVMRVDELVNANQEANPSLFTIIENPEHLEYLVEAEELMENRLSANKERYPEMVSLFYQDIQPIANPDDLFVLVNKNYQLDESYTPSKLTLPAVRTASGQVNTSIYLREEVSTQLEVMFEQALKENVHLIACSGYRSYATQKGIYSRYVRSMGQTAANLISAKAGHSEHQTGLAIDITSNENGKELNQSFANTTEGKWLKEHAYEYGFILRYPEGRETETGYIYEPWHFRYVGKEIATLMKEKGLIFEEYILIYQK